jgi:hypothetical protein
MSIRKKILSDINKFMDINDMSEVPRSWKMERIVFYAKAIEEEEKEEAAKKSGEH